MELRGLCLRADTFPASGPHVRRLAVSLQALEVRAGLVKSHAGKAQSFGGTSHLSSMLRLMEQSAIAS